MPRPSRAGAVGQRETRLNFHLTIMILGLDEITFAELRSSKKLVEALRAKIGDLRPHKFTDQELARKVNLLTEIPRETLMDR